MRLAILAVGGSAIAAAGFLSLTGARGANEPATSGNPAGDSTQRTAMALTLPAADQSSAAMKDAMLPPTTGKADTASASVAAPTAERAPETAGLATPANAGMANAALLQRQEPAGDAIQSANLTGQRPARQPAATAPADGDSASGNERTRARGSADKAAQRGDWHRLEVTRGDNLAALFQRAGLTARDVHEVVNAGEPARELTRLYPGDAVHVRTTDDDTLLGVRYEFSETDTLHVERTDDGYTTRVEKAELERRVTHSSAVIHSSLFTAGARVGLSDDLIMELAGIFGWDVDFALDIRRGDAFTVIYEEFYRDGEKVRNGDILAAEFVNQGESFRAVRYANDAQEADYYSPDGKSMRKAFLRTPVNFARVSSNFNPQRLHPVLGKKRPHMGTDYAARPGTPIKAAGDGKIVHRGRKGGYGRTIVLKHGTRYSTLYAHMSRYHGGLRTGDYVEQGQIIGYVGSSGMSTGPHLHYEFRIDGVHRNPRTVELPEAKPIPERLRADFERETRGTLARLAVFSRLRLAQSALTE